MNVARTRAELAAGLGELREKAATVALVPTMGALHEGHRRLLATAVAGHDAAVASIFVNPLQFGPGEDLDRYPRTLDADLDACDREGIALVFAPPVDQMYPHGTAQVTVDPGPLGAQLEGASRPGHFTGVLTVVAKLFGLFRPDAALFGEKDYQQLVLIRRMVRDLELAVSVRAVPTVREPDGLALSSRNRYLSAYERASALALPAALAAGAGAAREGAEAVLAAAGARLAAAPGVTADYVALRDPDLGPPPRHGTARLLVAARVGRTRLIDNAPVDLGEG